MLISCDGKIHVNKWLSEVMLAKIYKHDVFYSHARKTSQWQCQTCSDSHSHNFHFIKSLNDAGHQTQGQMSRVLCTTINNINIRNNIYGAIDRDVTWRRLAISICVIFVIVKYQQLICFKNNNQLCCIQLIDHLSHSAW